MKYSLLDSHLEPGSHLQRERIAKREVVEENQRLLLVKKLKGEPVLR